MVKEICPEMVLDYSLIDEKDADKTSIVYLTLKNHEIFSQGNFNVLHLQCIGFLLCKHQDRQSKLDEFWQLVNPEIEDQCSIERLI